MTGQTLLDMMELLNQELQNQPAEANVTRSLLALNVAQDYFESLAAARGKIFGSSSGELVALANTETTAFPSNLLRLDRLQLLDSTTGLPVGDLDKFNRAGGPGGSNRYPWWASTSTATTGLPKGYWSDGSCVYWAPIPSETRTIRYYGFVAAPDITAARTFAYRDICALPIASFATKLVKAGVDDSATDVTALAQETFSKTLDALSRVNRDGPVTLEYSEVHTT